MDCGTLIPVITSNVIVCTARIRDRNCVTFRHVLTSNPFGPKKAMVGLR